MKMRKRIKVDELPAFDAVPYLDSDEAIASYLTDILQANDAGLLSAALGDIARARGMTEIAKAAGITREALYKALRPGSAPRFDTVNVFAPPLAFAWWSSRYIRSDRSTDAVRPTSAVHVRQLSAAPTQPGRAGGRYLGRGRAQRGTSHLDA
jgi:probable addiction module antidote protein